MLAMMLVLGVLHSSKSAPLLFAGTTGPDCEPSAITPVELCRLTAASPQPSVPSPSSALYASRLSSIERLACHPFPVVRPAVS